MTQETSPRGAPRFATCRLMRMCCALATACLSIPFAAAAEDRSPAIPAGTWVHIDGEADPAGNFSPRRVRLEDALSKSLIRSRISVSADGGRRLTLLHFTVVTDSATTLYRGTARTPASWSELAAGVLVEAKVVRRGKRIVATRIRIEDAPETDRAASIDAAVERVDSTNGRLFFLGAPLSIPPDIPVADERGSHAVPAAATAGLRRDEDEQHVRPLQLGNAVTIGGRVETTLLDRDDFDLDEARPDKSERVDSRLQLLATAALTSTVEAYAKVSSARRIPIVDRRGASPATGDIRVEEAYLTLHQPGGLRLTAQVGRQRFRDAREWFFDEYLDAVRVRTDLAQWTFDVAMARGLFRPGEDDREARDAQHLVVSAATRLKDATLNAFLISRRADVTGQAPTWLGGTLSGRVTALGRYWSQIAFRRGHAADVRLRGWAVDLGTTWQLPISIRPSLTLGFATATGDDSPGDGVDGAFHQTELNDNKARFGGLKRFAYYGEALRPELSDVSIFTAGTSTAPLPKWSVDVVYHRYVRRSAGPWAGDMDIKSTADGHARHLGDEVDAIVASQAVRGVDFSVVVGFFRPGAAFPRAQSPAVVWRPQVRFYF